MAKMKDCYFNKVVSDTVTIPSTPAATEVKIAGIAEYPGDTYYIHRIRVRSDEANAAAVFSLYQDTPTKGRILHRTAGSGGPAALNNDEFYPLVPGYNQAGSASTAINQRGLIMNCDLVLSLSGTLTAASETSVELYVSNCPPGY